MRIEQGGLQSRATDESPSIQQEELRGISRTVAEIEWLLLILVMVYLTFGGPAEENRPGVITALVLYTAFILGFHYANFYKTESRWKIAIETWAMVLFITWVAWYTDRLASPLLNTYLLVIITSALALGKLVTLWEMVLVAACFVFLGDNSSIGELVSLSYIGRLAVLLAPIILVAYVTTMFSADIRFGLNRAVRLSEIDELTGVYNRRGFAMTVNRLFAQALRHNHPASILMIDLNKLKTFNDTYGHETGDQLLRLVAKCIRDALRQSDVLARYGGDEFVALLPETSRSGALDTVARMRSAVAATPLNLGDRSLVASLSIGVATYPDDGRSLDTLLVVADRAMYVEKRSAYDASAASTS